MILNKKGCGGALQYEIYLICTVYLGQRRLIQYLKLLKHSV